jgi:hypothetical protein
MKVKVYFWGDVVFNCKNIEQLELLQSGVCVSSTYKDGKIVYYKNNRELELELFNRPVLDEAPLEEPPVEAPAPEVEDA